MSLPHEVAITGRDGRTAYLRPILPSDREALAEGMHRLSAESRYTRFFSPLHDLSDTQLDYFTELDYRNHFAFGAHIDDPEHPGVGVARYIRRRDDPGLAEYAVVVVDDWHRNGVGSTLLDAVLIAAHHNGIDRCYGDILRTNTSMLSLVRRMGAAVEPGDPGEVRATFRPAERVQQLSGPLWDEVRTLVAEVSPPPLEPD